MDKPRILDVGCGSGLPTIELAKMSNGRVVGIDIDQSLLDELNRKIETEGLSDRVETRKCSMFETEFPDETFDIVWFEGATKMIDFEKALKECRRLLKPNGFLVIHDEIKTIAAKFEGIPNFGYKLVNHFLLPKDAWWIEYYRPLENRSKDYKRNIRITWEFSGRLKRFGRIAVAKKNVEEVLL